MITAIIAIVISYQTYAPCTWCNLTGWHTIFDNGAVSHPGGVVTGRSIRCMMLEVR
jgi:hypothetical protein